MLSKMNFHFGSADAYGMHAYESEEELLHDLLVGCHNYAEFITRLIFLLPCGISKTNTYHTL